MKSRSIRALKRAAGNFQKHINRIEKYPRRDTRGLLSGDKWSSNDISSGSQARNDTTAVTLRTIHGRQCTPLKSFQRSVYHCPATVSNLYLARGHRGDRFWYYTAAGSCTVARPAFIFHRYRETNIFAGSGLPGISIRGVSLQIRVLRAKFQSRLINTHLIFFPRQIIVSPKEWTRPHSILAKQCWAFHSRTRKIDKKIGESVDEIWLPTMSWIVLCSAVRDTVK